MRIITGIGIGALLVISTAPGRAADISLESAGARFGFTTAEGTKAFHQVEIVTEWRLPWRWNLGAGTNWYVRPQGEISAGWIGDNEKNAFIMTFGPRFMLGREHWPPFIFLGCNPTVMSREHFEYRDFGIPFQFTSYVGMGIDLGKRFNLTYRFQHMSNASFASPNPGLNLQMVGLNYRF